jgi:hypothetical protein
LCIQRILPVHDITFHHKSEWMDARKGFFCIIVFFSGRWLGWLLGKKGRGLGLLSLPVVFVALHAFQRSLVVIINIFYTSLSLYYVWHWHH